MGPDPEREDLVQQVFVRTHRSLYTYRGEAKFSTFFFQIIHNVAVDHLRKRTRRPALDYNALAETEFESSDPTPESVAANRQAFLQVWACLDRIKPAKRIALVLRMIEGRSLEEIAEETGTNVATVAQRIRHGRMELEKLYRKRRCGDPDQQGLPGTFARYGSGIVPEAPQRRNASVRSKICVTVKSLL